MKESINVPAASVYFPEEDKKEILEKIYEVLSNGQLTLGRYTKEFEQKFAEYVGTKYAVAVNSGTSAIEIPMRIFGVEGKEVLVPTNTFFATPAAVLHAGGKVRFVDTDPETFSIDIDDLKKKITKSTAGVIVVHIGGIITPYMEEIRKICSENNIFLFEDAAHAHGSFFNGKHAGCWGDAASFSFYPTKVITSGEGGMIVTNSEKVRDEAMLYRDQGKESFTTNVHGRLGYNWRLSEVHAIIGLSQLYRLNEFVLYRQKMSEIYNEEIKKIPKLKPLYPPQNGKSNYYKYIVMLNGRIERSKLKKVLKEQYNVSLSGEVYELPCHLQPIFKRLVQENYNLPKSEQVCSHHICLPISAVITEKQVEHVIQSLKEVLG